MTTIHYTGCQPDPDRHAVLVRELAAYAASQDWETITVNDADAALVGIILQPLTRLEPIPFLFDGEGRLHALGDLLAPGGEFILIVSVKTHYADTEAHRAFCELLRHIRDTHLPNLAVTDESGFWDHGNETELKNYFARLDRLTKTFSEHLENDVAPAPAAGTDNLIDCITLAAEMTHRLDAHDSRPLPGGPLGGS